MFIPKQRLVLDSEQFCDFCRTRRGRAYSPAVFDRACEASGRFRRTVRSFRNLDASRQPRLAIASVQAKFAGIDLPSYFSGSAGSSLGARSGTTGRGRRSWICFGLAFSGGISECTAVDLRGGPNFRSLTMPEDLSEALFLSSSAITNTERDRFHYTTWMRKGHVAQR